MANNTLPTAHLKIYIDSVDAEWKAKYAEHVKQHNEHIATDPFPNSGFDLLTPTDTHIMPDSLLTSFFLDLRIKTEMTYNNLPEAYYVFVRSSFSKTPLILSNHTGVSTTARAGGGFGSTGK